MPRLFNANDMQGKRKGKHEDDSTLRRSSRQKTQEKTELNSDVEIIEMNSSCLCKHLFFVTHFKDTDWSNLTSPIVSCFPKLTGSWLMTKIQHKGDREFGQQGISISDLNREFGTSLREELLNTDVPNEVNANGLKGVDRLYTVLQHACHQLVRYLIGFANFKGSPFQMQGDVNKANGKNKYKK